MSNQKSKWSVRESLVRFQDGQGAIFSASIQRLTRLSVIFEISGGLCSFRVSQVLHDFQIVLREQPVYSGRATVRNLVDTGTGFLCEATLSENLWSDLQFTSGKTANGLLRQGFEDFFDEWQKLCKVGPDYKVIVADMQTFLMDLRMWLDQVELGVRDKNLSDMLKLEAAVADQLAPPVLSCMDVFFEKFERIAMAVPEDLRPVHRSYMRRHLHPLIMGAPFAHRTFHKPLGYAGDYEMVNMIARNCYEGQTLYAKIVNTWFLRQAPAEAHRNRISFLKSCLVNETLRLKRLGRPARILNVGCGPALEIQELLRDSALSDEVEFTLLDFNEETVAYATASLRNLLAKFGRRTKLTFQKKSVHHILKEVVKANAEWSQAYDMVYCAGLFDYLAARTCQQLTDVFYTWTAPGGLVLTTNVEPKNPMRNGMEHLLDWNLVYRTAADMAKLKPSLASAENTKVSSDVTGVNVFLEARKPHHA